MNIVEISKILFFSSIAVWLLPPFKQFGTKVFFYFLLLALTDPIVLLTSTLFKINLPIEYNISVSYLLVISLLDKKVINEQKYILIFGFLFIFIVFFLPTTNTQKYIVLLAIQLLILAIFIKTFAVSYVFDKKILIFYLMLIFYQLTIISKFFNVLIGFADATAFFIITSIAQIFFGLFFSIYREDNARLAF
ncbi:MAG: hypothetical protein FJ214_04200 [Ignavibacteria bacterium]|nr:hypothetical protein [Ignavibacteria bacterium]